MPKVGMQPIRRQQLIEATLSAVNELGFHDASIVQIARRAGVSSGIISHYFKDKHGLMEATMRYLLKQLSQEVSTCLADAEPTAQARLYAIVAGNFSQSQVDHAAMKTWLAFWANSLHHPDLQRLQRINHDRLHSNLKHEFAKRLAPKAADQAAYGLAALIDGFWLRGALCPHAFDPDLTLQLCHDYIQQQLKQI